MTTTIVDMCADPLCMGEAEYDMISRVLGRRTKLCRVHRDRVLAAAERAGFGPEKVAFLDIRPPR